MRKSTLFISSVLTVFMLAILYGIVSAYQDVVKLAQPEPVVQSDSMVKAQSVERFTSLAPTPAGIVTPEQATSLAMEMIGRTDVYSVESTEYEGAAAYLVTFTSGDLVYVSPTGQILTVTQLAPVVVVPPPQRDNNDGSSQGGEREHEDEHEEREEHENGDDD